MGIPTYNNIQVLAIPVKEIVEQKQYLSIKFGSDDTAKHEVKNFVKEVCSNYAMPLDDLIVVIRNNPESFNDKTLKYINSLSDKQLKQCIQPIIYTTNSFGYGPSRELREGWKALVSVESVADKGNEPKSTIPFIFKVLGVKVKKEYFFYDKKFVNPYTIDKREIPEHINRIWDTDKDKDIYLKMLKKYEEEHKKKPFVDKTKVDATERVKLKQIMNSNSKEGQSVI
jgi:hypothetical protein